MAFLSKLLSHQFVIYEWRGDGSGRGWVWRWEQAAHTKEGQ